MVILFKFIIMLIGSSLSAYFCFMPALELLKALAYQISNFQNNFTSKNYFKIDRVEVILTILLDL